MNKKIWQPCQVEVISFDAQDVVTASGMKGDVDIYGDIFGA